MSAQGEKVREVKRYEIGGEWVSKGEFVRVDSMTMVAASDYDHLAEQVRRLREALTKIAEHGDERDEWDAVERYAQVRELAASALSTDRENGNGAQT